MTLSLTVPAAKHAENPCAVPDRVKAHVKDSVAVVKIPLFPGKLGIDFAEQVREVFDAQLNGAQRLVLDLRGNPGGGVGCSALDEPIDAKQETGWFQLRPDIGRSWLRP